MPELILFSSCFSFKLHLYAAQHFVHTPCTLMPQRGLCTVLEEEEETAISEKRHVFAELHNAPTYFFSHLKTKNNFFKYKSKNIYIA